ncbi:MAG TPA: discoidin domain-containing protein [Cytophagaceae bacterium]|nr:discoidin domain-containing protein [Cytophagaceae bacterium]
MFLTCSLIKQTGVLFFAIFIFIVQLATAQDASIIMQHGDLNRTGWNSNEKLLNTRYVSPASFGKLFSLTVDDQIYAQPLVISKQQMDSVRNIVLTATVNNTVYAFDAEKGKALWSKNYTPGGLRPPKNTDMTGACNGNYFDFSGNMGIVGTPAIDTATKTMYFVVRTTNGSGAFYQHLHAIDYLNNGAERAGSPVLIQATYQGNGDGSVGGIITFNPQKQNQRGGLLLLNGIVYIPYSAHCDWGPYHGWIIGYDASTLQQKIVYNSTPEGGDGGIWMSGGAPSVDEYGNIYVSVGNGTVGTTSNRSDLINRGESALKLTPSGSTLAVQTFFTPNNYQALEDADLDFGVTQLMLIPNTTMAITGCKDGNIYVLNRDNMGGFNATTNNVLQTISLGSGKTLRSSLAYYKGNSKSYFYTWSENAALKAFPFNSSTGLFDEANVMIGNVQGPNGQNGTLLAVSSDGSKDGSAVLWASHSAVGDAIHQVTPGILRAFDATDVTKELWNSNMNPNDNIGNYAKFVNPTIANGKVYMATFSKQLVIYGITDTTKLASCINATNVALNKTATASSIESATYPASNAVDGNKTTRWSSNFSDPQWLSLDLGAKYDICKIAISWEAAYGADFQIQVSDDATNWTTLQNVSGNLSQTNLYFVQGTGRYIRMYGTARATVYGYSIYEFEVYGTRTNTCPPSTNLSVTSITTSSATLNWDPVNAATSYNIQYKVISAPSFTSVSSVTNNVDVSALSCGSDYLFNVQSVCPDTSGSFSSNKAFSTVICDASCGFLPTRWVQQDIGSVGIAGSICFEQDTFFLHGSGADIGGSADAFRIAGTTFTGDGNVVGKVDNIDNSNPFNKCGVTFRETLDADSRHVMLVMTSTNGALFEYRQTKGGVTQSTNVTNITAPYWVKLIKKGTKYAGYISPDGNNWTQIGTSQDLGFGAATIFAGIGSTSHDNAVLSNSVMTEVPIFFDSDTTVNGTVTSVELLQAFNEVKIYPNPSSGNLFVELSNSAQIERVALFDMVGMEMAESTHIKTDKTSFDMSTLPQGCYMLFIFTKDKTYHQRIIKKD